jgi:hypothetical protein
MSVQWEPKRTWAFVVGVLEWLHSDSFSPFPKIQRRDAALVKLLEQRGVPTEQIVYLQDGQATNRRIKEALVEQLAAAQPGDTLLLYYCGHGGISEAGETYFASYDADGERTMWVVNQIPDLIDKHFAGARAMLFADACHSGHLADAVAAKQRRVAFASLGSSLASELSTGNWTFTEALIAGLRGEAYTDIDDSATITLAELADHIQADMIFAEEQIVTFATSKGFAPEFVIAPARARGDKRIGQQLEVESGGEWYPAQVIAVRGAELKVRYYGYESSDDEWVTPARTRAVTRARHPIGATVEVKWKSKWYPATVRDERGGVHYIQYEGYEEAWNEWVAGKRIRVR